MIPFMRRRREAVNSSVKRDDSSVVQIAGIAIGGEDARTAAWRATVADAARTVPLVDVAAVSLPFTLAPGRRVDVDSLARPVLEGLHDAGWFRRGLPSLPYLRVTRTLINFIAHGGRDFVRRPG